MMNASPLQLRILYKSMKGGAMVPSITGAASIEEEEEVQEGIVLFG